MRGVVVAPQPIAVRAGIDALAAGGNAFDAAVATAFAQGIVEPQMNGIGGFGSAICMEGASQKLERIDFHGRVPKYFPPDLWEHKIVTLVGPGRPYVIEGFENHVGYRSVTTPGTVAGLWEIHKDKGRLPWADVVRPAIRLAEEGFPVPAETYFIWLEGESSGDGHVPMPQKLKWTPASAAIYTKPDGSPYRIGETLLQKDYGVTLRRIAEGGAHAFYHGDIANQIEADFEANGGFLCAEDLAECTAEVGEPLLGTYRGYTIATPPLPSAGLQVIQLLNILEGFEISTMDPESPDYVDLIARALQATFVDKVKYSGDPEFNPVPVDELVSKDHATSIRNRIRRGEFFHVPVPEGVKVAVSDDTTHVCTWDSQGNAVSITHSLASASGVVTPGLGFMYNNHMGLYDVIPGYPNSIAPRKRRMMGGAPVLVIKDGHPKMVLGAPGGLRIVTAVLMTILNVIDHGMSPAEAVAAPRWHCDGPLLDMEARVYWNLKDVLRERGWTRIVGHNASYSRYFARAQCIEVRDDGTTRLGGDPRGGGGRGRWPL